jgi:alpha-ketoglutarate-dependent taurine dioxygenase
MDNLTVPFVVRRMAGAIGAEIGGVKLRPDLPDAVIAELRRLWLEHLVLFFRNLELDAPGAGSGRAALRRGRALPVPQGPG